MPSYGRTGTGQLFMPEEKEKEKGKDRLKSPTTTVVGCSAEGAQKAATTFDCAGRGHGHAGCLTNEAFKRPPRHIFVE